MKRVSYFLSLFGLLLSSISASAQTATAPVTVHDASETATSASTPGADSAMLVTHLSTVIFDEPATDEGFATVRIADEAGEAVYRGMMLVAAGARSLDLSAVRIPAAGRYTVRVVYPGGTVVQELETPYTAASATATNNVTAGW